TGHCSGSASNTAPRKIGGAPTAELDPSRVLPTIRPIERMPPTKQLIAIGLGVGMLNSPPGHSAQWESGPLIQEFNLTLAPGRRVEALGPLLSYQQGQKQTQWALPPLFSHASDEGADVEEFDLAYPLLTYDRFGKEYRFQILQVLSLAGGKINRSSPKSGSLCFRSIFNNALRTPTRDTQRWSRFTAV